jgi:hypothetical protein
MEISTFQLHRGVLTNKPTRTRRVLRFNGVTDALIEVFVSSERGKGWGDIAFGPDGNLYVCSSTRGVLRFDGTLARLLMCLSQS